MNVMISQAIADGRVLSFSYKGELRTVEPHTYGRKSDGRDSLCGWQTDGGSTMGMEGLLMALSTPDNNTTAGSNSAPPPQKKN